MYDLSLQNIVIAPGVEFTVAGPLIGRPGTLTVDARGVTEVAAISTTGATFTVTGGVVTAYAGLEGAAIGGANTQSGGTLNVAGGTVNATSDSPAKAAAVGGGYGGGNGGTVTVSDGTLNATAQGFTAPAIGGGSAGLNPGDRGGSGGSLTIGPDGEVEISDSPNSFGGGQHHSDGSANGYFGSVVVNGILRITSGVLQVDDDPTIATEVVVGSTGQILGLTDDPASGASITGTGRIDNQGAITLNPPATMVTGNNKLVSFNTGDTSVRVFAPTFTTGARTLPIPPTGTLWNTANDGSGEWFTTASSTTGSGTITLYAVAPATLSVSPTPADLTALAGTPFTFPVTATDPTGTPLSPQPAITYTSADCTITPTNTFTTAGPCTITATTTVQSTQSSTVFTITVIPGPVDLLTITPQANTVNQGGSLTFTVNGKDALGNPVDTSTATLTSSITTDLITGHTITFPHASPHTITATLAGKTAQVTINVTPALPNTDTDTLALPNTGTDTRPSPPIIICALALLLTGTALLLTRRHTKKP